MEQRKSQPVDKEKGVNLPSRKWGGLTQEIRRRRVREGIQIGKSGEEVSPTTRPQR